MVKRVRLAKKGTVHVSSRVNTAAGHEAAINAMIAAHVGSKKHGIHGPAIAIRYRRRAWLRTLKREQDTELLWADHKKKKRVPTGLLKSREDPKST